MLLALLVSCKESSNKNTNVASNDYKIEISNNMSKISVVVFLNKFKSNDDFSFVVTKNSCTLCKEFYSILKEHRDIKIDYEIQLDNADKNYKEDLKKLKNILPNLMVAPDLNFKKGNKIYRFDLEYSDINYENLSSWLKKYK